MNPRPLADLLARRGVLVLDGALGTELQRRGVDTGLPLWSAHVLIEDPGALLRLHRDHCTAGADIITANTWRTTPRTFRRAGLPDRSAELTRLAVDLTRRARDGHPGRTILVAGSMGPLEDCYRPDLVPPDPELNDEHRLHATRLADLGVDLLMLETFGTVREVRTACAAATATGLEVLVSLLARPDGRLWSGEPIADAVAALAPLRPAAFSLNCAPARSMATLITTLRSALTTHFGAALPPIGVYANAGREGEELTGELVEDVGPEEYALLAIRWSRAGASIIGGCCGTRPEHCAAVADALERERTDGGAAR